MKNQAPKSPLQVAPAPSSASAPAVPGVNDFTPGKIVVSNGGAKEVRLQLTPTATPEEAAQQRQQTRNLLFISTENLKRIAGHDLDDNQQDMLEQVHNYMTQARAADKAGELQRAEILASKARQLSDDLAGVRTILKLWPW
jgi:Tfp pilus assembly protein PilW